MATLPNSLRKISLFLERLPGIGAKTANRLAFYLLRMPEEDLKEFGSQVSQLKAKTKLCRVCLNMTEEELCPICTDPNRDFTTITVVESVLDLLSLETGNIYNGAYHVLHGRIDPLNNIGPDDIYIPKLIDRARSGSDINGKIIEPAEIVLATNPDMEGEATAMYIRSRLEEVKSETGRSFTVSRIAYGLPMGANLEYADYGTLKKALDGRNKI